MQRPHPAGPHWTGWGFNPKGIAGFALALFLPGGEPARHVSAFWSFREDVLDQEPELTATPRRANLHELAGDADFDRYLGGTEHKRGWGGWAIGSGVYDPGLIAIALALLPEVETVALEHLVGRGRRRDLPSALTLTTRDAFVVVAPCKPETRAPERLLERGERVVLVPNRRRSRAA